MVFRRFFDYLCSLRTESTTETCRKRRAEDTLGCQDAKILRLEAPNTYGENQNHTGAPHTHWRIHDRDIKPGQVCISKWEVPNGKENKNLYLYQPNSPSMHYQTNVANISAGQQNNVRVRTRRPPKEVEKISLEGASFSSDNEVVELPQPQSSGIRDEPVCMKVPVSPALNRRQDDDIQVISERSPASKVFHQHSNRRPFKAIDPTSRESSTPMTFGRSRQMVRSPDQSRIETLPSANMANFVGQHQFRSHMPASGSCSARNSTLNQMFRSAEREKYSKLVMVYNSDMIKPSTVMPSHQEPSSSTIQRLSELQSSSRGLINHHVGQVQAACERIAIPVERISSDVPSTSATRHQAEDSDLQFLGQVTHTSRQSPKDMSSEFHEILQKYAEKEKTNRLKLQEMEKRSRLLEDRNKQASKLKKMEDVLEIERSLRTYLRLIDEIPSEKEEEIPTLPELSADMEAEIDAALSAPPDAVLSSAFNLTIKGRDMRTLKPLAWLNDEVINFYMNLLIERGKEDRYPSVYAFNTFFFPKLLSTGYDSLKRWTKKVDIFQHDYLIVPVHRGMHWCMAIIDVKGKIIRYYDSLNGRYPQCADALLNYLQKESLDKKKQAFDTTGWEKIHAEDIPQQNNGSDCGMFACMYAEYVSRGVPITFTQDNMLYFRRKAVFEILKVKLLC